MKQQMVMIGTAAGLGLLALGCSSARGGAESDNATQHVASGPDAAGPHPQHGPPPEAFAACKGSTDGAACTVVLEERSIDGTCRGGPNGEPELACVPKLPPGPPGGPPKEAFDACQDLSTGDPCGVKLEAKTIAGECRKGPAGQAPLACVPNDMPPPPPHHGPPKEALEACKALEAGAACSVKLEARTLAGECRQGPGGHGPLACAPKDMPPPPPPPSETE